MFRAHFPQRSTPVPCPMWHFAHGTSGALLLIAGGSVAVAKDGGENTQGYLDLLKMGNPLLGE